jgi:phosphoribosyl-AMP cyclohydrolase
VSTAFWLDAVKWNEQGLVATIAQDASDGTVLMMAWMNRESLALTLEKQRAIYWSRSRNRLWAKGEESGHVQKLREVRLDCDGDTLLLQVEQIGNIACHTGRRHCFFKKLENQQWTTTDPVLKDPSTMYKKP